MSEAWTIVAPVFILGFALGNATRLIVAHFTTRVEPKPLESGDEVVWTDGFGARARGHVKSVDGVNGYMWARIQITGGNETLVLARDLSVVPPEPPPPPRVENPRATYREQA